MAETTYSYTRELVDGDWNAPANKYLLDASGDRIFLSKQIEDAIPGLGFVLRCDGTAMDVVAERALTGAEKVTLDSTVSGHKSGGDSLDANKRGRLAEVNAKSVELIGTGFAYGGKQFSLSLEAQVNWTNVGLNSTLLTYPYVVATIDDTDSLSLANTAAAEAAYAAAVARKEGVLTGGTSLKSSINAAIDQAALDAVVDSRT